MISQGASHVNLSCVIDDAHALQAVRLLHQGLGLDVGPDRHTDRTLEKTTAPEASHDS